MNRVRMGVVGTGIMGGNHVKWLLDHQTPNAVLTAVCDIRKERRDWAQSLCSEVQTYEAYEDLIASGSVDAVIIATPHDLHPVIAAYALRHGVHALSEKPIGVYAKSLDDLFAAVDAHPELVFGIMFNQRTNPIFAKAKEMVDGGKIGKIRRATWISTDWWRPQNYYDMSTWRATWAGEGGGVLLNQAPHQLDLFQWICGMPTRVYADLKYGSHRRITVEDDATVMMRLQGSATASFIFCTHDVIGTNRFEITGDCGKIVIDKGRKLTAMLLHESESDMNARMTFDDAAKIINGGMLKDIMDTYEFDEYIPFGAQHCQIVRGFCDAILNHTPLLANGKEGVNSLTMSNAMYLSSWLDRPIDIPMDQDLFYAELCKRIADEKACGC